MLAQLQNQTIILDANLAVLLSVGAVGQDQITNHKRCTAYDQNDWIMLRQIIQGAKQILVSPHVLSETSNLGRATHNKLAMLVSQSICHLIENSKEIFISSEEIISDASYFRLGLTDAGLLKLLSQNTDYYLMTADLDLYLEAMNRGYAAINFAHIQAARPDFK